MGEHCLGGGCFLSPDCIRKLAEAGLLLRKELCSSALGEDHVWGLLLKSLGIGMADFASGTFPMGVKWQGLPFSPQQLLDKGKKVIHSTRFWKETEGEGDLNEEQIRKFFRDIRQQPRSSALGCLADNLDLQSGNGSTTAFAPVATAPGPQSGRDRPQPVSEGGP
jgi:hypothetical protein